MNIEMKKTLFLTVMIVVSYDCFGMYRSGEGPVPGGYPVEIERYPAGSNVSINHQPVSSYFIMPENMPQLPPLPVVEGNSQLLPFSVAKDCNKHFDEVGIASDTESAEYINSTYLLSTFGQTISDEFMRTTNNSTFFVARCGNTYKQLYTEENYKSSFFVLSCFNTYEKGCSLTNKNTFQLGLSVGDVVNVVSSSNVKSKSHGGANLVLPISRDAIKAMLIGIVALKLGVVQAALTAVGLAAPTLVVVPIVIGAAIIFPVVMMIGGSLLIAGFTTAIALAGVGISLAGVLIPFAVPALIIKELLGL